MTDGFEDPKVVSLDCFRQQGGTRSNDEKFDEALVKQNRQGALNYSASLLETNSEQFVLERTAVLRDDIMRIFREMLLQQGLRIDHPNLWQISALVEEMVEVGYKTMDLEIAQDLMMIDEREVFSFDPLNYTGVVTLPPVKGWTDYGDDE